MPYLPPELTSEILLRLPVKDVIRFSSVSKLWNSFIRSKDFIKEHHQRALNSTNDRTLTRDDVGQLYSVPLAAGRTDAAQLLEHPLNSIEYGNGTIGYYLFIGFCNGLILVELHKHNKRERKDTHCLFLWNPTIARHIQIRVPDIKPFKAPFKAEASITHYLNPGLGYHSIEDDFKVLLLIKSRELHVYSIASCAWKRVEKRPPNLIACDRETMVSLNNSCVAWLMTDPDNKNRIFVVIFDLVKEDYHSFPVHDEVDNIRRTLVVLGGSLAIFCCTREGRDVWFMKDSHSWCMKLTIKAYCEPLLFDGENFLCLEYPHNKKLIWYNIKTHESYDAGCSNSENYNGTSFCVGNLRLLLDGHPDRCPPTCAFQLIHYTNV